MANTGNQLTIIVFLRAREGKTELLGKCLLEVVEPTRAERGNINYDLHRSNEDPNVWALYENWRSEADLDAHFNMSYLTASLCGQGIPSEVSGALESPNDMEFMGE